MGLALAVVVMLVVGGGSGQTVGLTAALCDDLRDSAGSESSQLTLNRAVSDHPRPFDPEGRGEEKEKGRLKMVHSGPIGKSWRSLSPSQRMEN